MNSSDRGGQQDEDVCLCSCTVMSLYQWWSEDITVYGIKKRKAVNVLKQKHCSLKAGPHSWSVVTLDALVGLKTVQSAGWPCCNAAAPSADGDDGGLQDEGGDPGPDRPVVGLPVQSVLTQQAEVWRMDMRSWQGTWTTHESFLVACLNYKRWGKEHLLLVLQR